MDNNIIRCPICNTVIDPSLTVAICYCGWDETEAYEKDKKEMKHEDLMKYMENEENFTSIDPFAEFVFSATNEESEVIIMLLARKDSNL